MNEKINKSIRKILSSFWFIHLMVGLGFFALFGYIALDVFLDNKYGKFLLLCVALSFCGAVCGSFIKVIDTINNKK
ncbi:MAG: hypothetical protein Q7U04_09585 [Bacteriovorax sp.]|nr:hypothetical protein [Bacteriovorax sp.]